jgi:hypothetical protein
LLVLGLAAKSLSLTVPRYLTLAAPAVYALVCAVPHGRIQKIVGTIAIFAAATSFAFSVWPWNDRDRDWRGVGAYINADAKPDDVVVFCGSGNGLFYADNPRFMSLCVSHHVKVNVNSALVVGESIPAHFLKQLDRYPRVWLVTFAEEDAARFRGWKFVKSFGSRSVTAGIVMELINQKEAARK